MVNLTEMLGSRSLAAISRKVSAYESTAAASLIRGEDVLAQPVQRRRQALRGQPDCGQQRVFESVSGDEAGNQARGTMRLLRMNRSTSSRSAVARIPLRSNVVIIRDRVSAVSALPAKKSHRGHRRQRHDAEHREWRRHACRVRERAHRGRTGDQSNVARKPNGADRAPASPSQTKDQVAGRAVSGHLANGVQRHRREQPGCARARSAPAAGPTPPTPKPIASARAAPALRMMPPMGIALARWTTLTKRSIMPT